MCLLWSGVSKSEEGGKERKMRGKVRIGRIGGIGKKR